MGCIYKLTFTSGKSYIGQTVRSMSTRITQHKAAITAGSMLAVHCAWREHGAPEVQVIARSNDPEQLHSLERAAIIEHGTLSPGGYNISTGGDTAPSKSPEVAAKIAAKARGRVVPQEKREQIAESMRKRWEDPEYRQTVLQGLQGSNTEEVSQKRSASAKARWQKQFADGWTFPESARVKLTGRAFSDETRAKMSAAAKGKKKAPRSEETKAKLAAAAKAFWSDPERKAKRAAQMKAGQSKARDAMSAAAKARWAAWKETKDSK